MGLNKDYRPVIRRTASRTLLIIALLALQTFSVFAADAGFTLSLVSSSPSPAPGETIQLYVRVHNDGWPKAGQAEVAAFQANLKYDQTQLQYLGIESPEGTMGDYNTDSSIVLGYGEGHTFDENLDCAVLTMKVADNAKGNLKLSVSDPILASQDASELKVSAGKALVLKVGTGNGSGGKDSANSAAGTAGAAGSGSSAGAAAGSGGSADENASGSANAGSSAGSAGAGTAGSTVGSAPAASGSASGSTGAAASGSAAGGTEAGGTAPSENAAGQAADGTAAAAPSAESGDTQMSAAGSPEGVSGEEEFPSADSAADSSGSGISSTLVSALAVGIVAVLAAVGGVLFYRKKRNPANNPASTAKADTEPEDKLTEIKNSK